MTATKDMHQPRPSVQHRPSSSVAGTAPSRQPRPHSHSLSAGSINSAHRVTRRKSMTSTNLVAMAAAAKASPSLGAESGASSARRSSKAGSSPKGPPFPSSLPNHDSGFEDVGFPKNSSAVADGPPLSSISQEIKSSGKARMRRASEGARLSKTDPKRQSGGELRCEKCGKGYKHSSCLTKHLWEHTPEWAFTSKLLISKHQQVQLLEAASVLVAMNQEPASAEGASDSASPTASGSSDPRDDYLSSTETTPPPGVDDSSARPVYGHSKRVSSTSSVYSRSYQSTSGASVLSESAPNNHSFHYRQWSSDQRPSTAATSVNGSQYEDEDQADLAAAVGLLSCSYGTPKSGPVMLPPDVPPVPPLPARFLNGDKVDATPKGNAIFVTTRECDTKDVDMDEDDQDLEAKGIPTVRNDEYEDGVFGMEE